MEKRKHTAPSSDNLGIGEEYDDDDDERSHILIAKHYYLCTYTANSLLL